MTPLVSIIIPCFNSGADLPEALASVAAQTVGEVEVIVVDDGSTDPATLGVLDALPEEVRLVRQDNRGLAAARNAGMAAATGKFLLPLDSDDQLEPTFLERCLAALAAHPDAAFAFAGLRLIGEKRGVLPKTYNFFAQLVLNQLPYCLLLRRSTWEASGGYDEAMRLGYEDWEFNIRLGARGQFGVAVAEPLFVYRVRKSGMLQSISRRRHAQLWAFIRAKHAALYTPAALLACRRRWRRGLPYSTVLLAGLLAAHAALPAPAFNVVFATLQRLSASSRASKSGT
jgi:glycosyltransferase involved in cell wall biosynthesis